jgi:hypothetical protein
MYAHHRVAYLGMRSGKLRKAIDKACQKVFTNSEEPAAAPLG